MREPASEVPEAPAEDAEQAARLHEAERVLREGRYEEAIALFEQIGQRARTIWAYEQYAQFLAEAGRYQDAYEQMRRAIHRSRW
jgi:tetratricopeptide (TPR) repeat protein